jgi:5-methylcytosine-specific restriction endonuclease McrA
MNWRAEAIERVINAVQKLVPISHIVIREPLRGSSLQPLTDHPETRRERLIAAYGATNAAGERIARCAYCGTTEGQIEIDHLLPKSRGGTDRWSNLVLSCAACNARKGDRTVAEAGMSLRTFPHQPSDLPSRNRPYTYHTARLLVSRLHTTGLHVAWQSARDTMPNTLSPALIKALDRFADDPCGQRCSVIAKPIARPHKQVFSSRNYPLSTPETSMFTRVGQTVKRRIQVNKALARWHEGERVVTQVVGATEPVPSQAEQIITLGMLCEARRAGRMIVGIVSAIHSDSRLTLLVPSEASARRVAWQRIVVGVQRHLRVLSNDGVVFLPVPDQPQETRR